MKGYKSIHYLFIINVERGNIFNLRINCIIPNKKKSVKRVGAASKNYAPKNI